MDTQRKFKLFTSTDVGAAAVAGNAWVTLDFGPVSDTLPTPDRRKKVLFHRVKVQRASGVSATAHTTILADVTGSASTVFAAKYASAAVPAATALEAKSQDYPMYTDATGKLFFTTGGDGADTFEYELAFEVLS